MQLRRAAGALLLVAVLTARRANAQASAEQGRATAESGATPSSSAATPDPQPAAVAPPTHRVSTSNLTGTVGSEIAEYADTDHVFVFTPSIAGAVSNPTAGWSVNAGYLVDAVSAASVDIVSTASRRWEEVRQEGSLAGSYHPGNLGVGANAIVSSEPDYLSLNAGASVTQDLLNKNLTWLFSYEYGHDVSGRTGTPFSVFSHEIDHHSLKAGVTLLLDHATIVSFVADVIFDIGDESKPYRYIPLFAPGVYVPVGASVADVTSLRVSERPLEQLPLSRQRFATSGRLAHRFRSSTVRVDERLYVDTWGMKATTTDARYLFDLGRFEVGPHLRIHGQSPVDFWQRAYVMGPGFTYPALRTGDRELGPLLTATGGGSLQVALGSKAAPRAWVIGIDLNGMWTQYFDDLYITQRWSFVGGVSLEAAL